MKKDEAYGFGIMKYFSMAYIFHAMFLAIGTVIAKWILRFVAFITKLRHPLAPIAAVEIVSTLSLCESVASMHTLSIKIFESVSLFSYHQQRQNRIHHQGIHSSSSIQDAVPLLIPKALTKHSILYDPATEVTPISSGSSSKTSEIPSGAVEKLPLLVWFVLPADQPTMTSTVCTTICQELKVAMLVVQLAPFASCRPWHELVDFLAEEISLGIDEFFGGKETVNIEEEVVNDRRKEKEDLVMKKTAITESPPLPEGERIIGVISVDPKDAMSSTALVFIGGTGLAGEIALLSALNPHLLEGGEFSYTPLMNTSSTATPWLSARPEETLTAKIQVQVEEMQRKRHRLWKTTYLKTPQQPSSTLRFDNFAGIWIIDPFVGWSSSIFAQHEFQDIGNSSFLNKFRMNLREILCAASKQLTSGRIERYFFLDYLQRSCSSGGYNPASEGRKKRTPTPTKERGDPGSHVSEGSGFYSMLSPPVFIMQSTEGMWVNEVRVLRNMAPYASIAVPSPTLGGFSLVSSPIETTVRHYRPQLTFIDIPSLIHEVEAWIYLVSAPHHSSFVSAESTPCKDGGWSCSKNPLSVNEFRSLATRQNAIRARQSAQLPPGVSAESLEGFNLAHTSSEWSEADSTEEREIDVDGPLESRSSTQESAQPSVMETISSVDITPTKAAAT